MKKCLLCTTNSHFLQGVSLSTFPTPAVSKFRTAGILYFKVFLPAFVTGIFFAA